MNLTRYLEILYQKIHIIDYEWIFEFPVPRDYILLRTAINAYAKYLNNNINSIISLEEIMAYFGISMDMFEKIINCERNFLIYVYGEESVPKDFETFFQIYKGYLTEIYTPETLLRKNEKLLQSKAMDSELVNTLEEQIHTYQEKIQEYESKIIRYETALADQKLQNDAIRDRNASMINEIETFKKSGFGKMRKLYHKIKRVPDN
jgi:hypothetical protein